MQFCKVTTLLKSWLCSVITRKDTLYYKHFALNKNEKQLLFTHLFNQNAQNKQTPCSTRSLEANCGPLITQFSAFKEPKG